MTCWHTMTRNIVSDHQDVLWSQRGLWAWSEDMSWDHKTSHMIIRLAFLSRVMAWIRKIDFMIRGRVCPSISQLHIPWFDKFNYDSYPFSMFPHTQFNNCATLPTVLEPGSTQGTRISIQFLIPVAQFWRASQKSNVRRKIKRFGVATWPWVQKRPKPRKR